MAKQAVKRTIAMLALGCATLCPVASVAQIETTGPLGFDHMGLKVTFTMRQPEVQPTLCEDVGGYQCHGSSLIYLELHVLFVNNTGKYIVMRSDLFSLMVSPRNAWIWRANCDCDNGMPTVVENLYIGGAQLSHQGTLCFAPGEAFNQVRSAWFFPDDVLDLTWLTPNPDPNNVAAWSYAVCDDDPCVKDIQTAADHYHNLIAANDGAGAMAQLDHIIGLCKGECAGMVHYYRDLRNDLQEQMDAITEAEKPKPVPPPAPPADPKCEECSAFLIELERRMRDYAEHHCQLKDDINMLTQVQRKQQFATDYLTANSELLPRFTPEQEQKLESIHTEAAERMMACIDATMDELIQQAETDISEIPEPIPAAPTGGGYFPPGGTNSAVLPTGPSNTSTRSGGNFEGANIRSGQPGVIRQPDP